ncbi:fimbrillin family protein [Bacteroides sp. 224]|uniref:fimbrillin family protein n=1 Tax=Bacteroides sp. 224 TaxID=2302936 RepID=UPI0013D495A6|nr:fimbrillin family protein [Bacteroides sp. 224]NDV63682.1 hypothetical protein [Bacteroides sp. 224]
MKTRTFGLLLIAATLALPSCSDDNADDLQNRKGIATFVSGINEYATRVNDEGDKWVSGDSIGIYMLKNATSATLPIAQNAKYYATTEGVSTSFSSQSPFFYPTDGTAVDFIAYHPHSGKLVGAKYAINLENQSKQSALDLMYANSNAAKAEGYTQDNQSAVELTFSHVLTKLILKVTAEEDISNMSATIKGMNKTGEFDLLAGKISSSSSTGDIIPNKTPDGHFESILLPIATLSASHIVEFNINGKVYKWVMNKNSASAGGSIEKLEKGYKYTFHITLSESGINAEAVSSSGSASPWEDGGSGNGSASKDKDEEIIDAPVVGKVDPTLLSGYGEKATGGQGATAENILHFNDGYAFAEWLKLREKNKSMVPAIVWLSGEFTAEQGRSGMFDVKRTSNISFIGTDDFVMNKVGIFANEAQNIIFRNLHIKLPAYSADGLSMQESNTIWVDHCTFESLNQTKDAEDGSCDITHGTYNVTVSWCKFVKTQKSCLVGHSNSNGSEDQNISVTFHHNHFDNSGSRHPRLRFGKAHVYNNFYDNVTTYGAGSAYGGKLLLEENYFDNVKLPTDICTFPAKKSGSNWVSNLTGSVAGYLYERNNTYANKPSDAGEVYPLVNTEYTAYGNESTKLSTPLTYDDFKPTYTYVVDDLAELPEIVRTNAGVGKMSGYATAPIEVNNGGITPGETPGSGGEDEGTSDPVITLENDWYVVGYNSAKATTTLSAEGALSLTGTGKFESGKQSMAYVYRAIEGNFTITTKLANPTFNVSKNQKQAHLGLMLVPDLSKSTNEFLFSTASYAADSNYYSCYRATSGSNCSNKAMSGATGTGDVYLKLQRNGSTVSASYSLDGGLTYSKTVDSAYTNLPNKVCVGLVASSGDSSATATGTFSNIQINGADAPAFTE